MKPKRKSMKFHEIYTQYRNGRDNLTNREIRFIMKRLEQITDALRGSGDIFYSAFSLAIHDFNRLEDILDFRKKFKIKVMPDRKTECRYERIK
jgi:hypothetical protein